MNKNEEYQNQLNEMLKGVDINKVMGILSQSMESLDKKDKEQINNTLKSFNIDPAELLKQVDNLIDGFKKN